MAKKKKKKKPVSPEVKFKRRVKKYTKRTIFLAIIVVIYFKVIPILMPSYAPQIANTQSQLLLASKLVKKQVSQVLGIAIEVSENIASGKESAKKIDAEVLVDKAVNDLKDRIKALPQEQVKKVKRNFCSDVIEEAISDEEQTKENNEN